MTTTTAICVFLAFFSLWCLCIAQNDGQIRLTGLNSTRVGRLEVFLNGQWGTVSNKDIKDSLSFGETVCYQLNNALGRSTKVVSGTVSSINKILDKQGKKELDLQGHTDSVAMYDLDCGSSESENGLPQHILRCSYKKSDGSRKNDKNDLAVICDNLEMSPFIGQVRLVSAAGVASSGVLEMYASKYWGNVCYDGFDTNAADTACRQLGYTNAKTFSEATSQSASKVWLDDAACGENNTMPCSWNCLSKVNTDLLYYNISKYCVMESYVTLDCEFNTDLASEAKSPGIGNACQVPPQKLSFLFIVILVLVFIGILLVMLLLCGLILAICCCCNLSLCCGRSATCGGCGGGCPGDCCQYSAV